MVEINITELKTLAPDKRIEELKKLLSKFQKKKNKETIKIIEELIEETKEELFALEKLVVGESKKVVPVEKEEEKEKSLEERAKVEREKDEKLIALTKQEKDAAYSLSKTPINDLYNKLSDVYKDIKSGEASEDQKEYAQILKVALYKKENDVKAGRYNPDEESVERMNQAERIVKYMKGDLEQDRSYQ